MTEFRNPNLEIRNSISENPPRKDATDEAKPAGSEQLAAGSNSDYGLQDSMQ